MWGGSADVVGDWHAAVPARERMNHEVHDLDPRPAAGLRQHCRETGLIEPAVLSTEAEDLLRRLAPQVLGALVRRYGHFDTAEDATQEALLAAATRWGEEGLPDNPRAWLITVASRRLTDLLRSDQARRRREDTVARWTLPDDWLALAADEAASRSGGGGAAGAADDSLISALTCQQRRSG